LDYKDYLELLNEKSEKLFKHTKDISNMMKSHLNRYGKACDTTEDNFSGLLKKLGKLRKEQALLDG
jgi:hypothetical protein